MVGIRSVGCAGNSPGALEVEAECHDVSHRIAHGVVGQDALSGVFDIGTRGARWAEDPTPGRRFGADDVPVDRGIPQARHTYRGIP